VLHITSLSRNLIYVSKMSDAGVDTLFQKDFCNRVRCVMVLIKVVWISTMYKLLGNVDSTGCKKIISPKIKSIVTQLDSMLTQLDSNQANSIQTNLTQHDELEPTKLWHKRMGHIGEK
jgi:hypothetical protein